MLQTLDQVSKQQNINLHSLFSQQQLIFNACISELLRQISLECKERADLIQNIWNNHVEVTSKVVEFYSKENNRVEWDTLNQVKSLHQRYRDELQLSQKFYDDNNSKYNINKKQLEAVLSKYRLERKINKKLEKLCNQLKNDKKQINNLYCETSKEYIQAMINTGKLPQAQENYLLSQYLEASKGSLSRQIDFKVIKESIQLKEYSQQQNENLVDKIVQGKTPNDSEESADDEEEVRQIFQKRRIRFEEKSTQVEEIKKVTTETETEFNKLFMVSKGVQIMQNPKRVIETQTEIETFNQSIQTEPKQLKHQHAQTEMTATKGDDFEKLKTVYLKKIKVDPVNNKQIDQDTTSGEDFDSNQLQVQDSKEQKKQSAEDVNSPISTTSKFQRNGQKKTSIKKNRASIFAQSLTKQQSNQANEGDEINESDAKSEDGVDKTYDFESQKKLRVFLQKISEYTKQIRIDSRKITRESIKQFELLAENIKSKVEQLQNNSLNLQIINVDQAMEIEEYKNIQLLKDKQTEILIKNQSKINMLANELNLSTDDEQDQSQTPKQIVSQLFEGQLNRNKSTSSIGTIQIKEPFSHHQNVQNLINESEKQANKADKGKRSPSIRVLPIVQRERQGSNTTNQQSNPGSSTDMFKPKHLAFQRRQSQMVSQLFNLASTPATNQMNTSQTNIQSNADLRKYSDNKKALKKIKNIIKSNNIVHKVNINAMNFQQRQKECFEDSEVLLIVEQLQSQANQSSTISSETIALKNSVIQIRKLLQQVYTDLIKSIKNGEKLNKPLSILLREFFQQQAVESKTISLSKMRKILEKCLTIPKSYEEILIFTQLTGICKSNQILYDSCEFLNIYLQILAYLNIDNQQETNQIQVIHSSLKTTTTQIYQYLPSILSTYLPDKTIYDIVMHLLKPYIDEEDIGDRDNLINIPQPEEQEIPFNDVLTYVLNKFKDHSQSISKVYNTIYECITFNDLEEITEEQFMFLQKYLGSTEKNKIMENLYKFRDLSSRQAIDKQTFIGFCNRNQVVDDFRYKSLIEGKDYDDLTGLDFETTDKLDIIWKKQKLSIQKLLFEVQVYKPIHKRLITVMDSYIGIAKKNVQYRKYYKPRSILAYKLLKMEMRYYIQQQLIKNIYIPEALLQIQEASEPILINHELKFIGRKQRVLKKGVSVVYPNVFQKNKLTEEDEEIQSNSDESNNSSSSSISNASGVENKVMKQESNKYLFICLSVCLSISHSVTF